MKVVNGLLLAEQRGPVVMAPNFLSDSTLALGLGAVETPLSTSLPCSLSH